MATDIETEEVEAFFKGHNPCLVLVECQAPWFQPSGQPRLDLFGLLPGMAAGDHVVGVPHKDRSSSDGMNPVVAVSNSCGLLQPMQRHVQQQRADHTAL
jgi:hypothetical protein